MVLVLAGACSANAAKPERSQPEVAVDELDVAFDEHVATTALPLKPVGMNGFAETLRRKVEGIHALERAYAAFTESNEGPVRARAWHRIGQLYLNAGCEIATIELPEAAREVGKVALLEQAKPLTARSLQAFHNAAAESGEYADSAKTAVDALGRGVEPGCIALEPEWATPERPTGIASAATKDHAADCAGGDAAACIASGLKLVDSDELDDAAAAFDRACELDGRCRHAVAIAAPSGKDAYRKACDQNDAIGCLRLGRLLNAEAGKVCTSTEVPQTKSAAKRCQKDDAMACFAQAAALIRKTAVALPEEKAAGILGVLRGGEFSDDPQELAQQCDEKNAFSCIRLADAQEKAGKDPRATLQKACDSAPFGCHALAEHLLTTKSQADMTVAVDLLTKNCGASRQSCKLAASLFAAGERVPRSDACAAALSWNGCQPDRLWACDDINGVFGHAEAK